MSCSLSASCDLSAKPAEELPCESGSCSTTFLCKLFSSEGVTCVFIVSGAALALCVCCCGLTAFGVCVWGCRRDAFIPSLGHSVGYEIDKVDVEDPWSGERVTKDRVVWNIEQMMTELHGADMHIQDDFDMRGDSVALSDVDRVATRKLDHDVDRCHFFDDFDEGDAEMEVSSSSSASSDNVLVGWTIKPMIRKDAAGQDEVHDVSPAFTEGAEVEYFSCAHNIWLMGRISLSTLSEMSNGTERIGAMVYDVVLGRTHQHRRDVQLHLLRRPLVQNECVDVLCKTIWRPGRILKVLKHHTGRWYLVRMDDPEKTTEAPIPGVLLRRRFCSGELVRVYRGHVLGWVAAVMQDQADPADNAQGSAASLDGETEVAHISTSYKCTRKVHKQIQLDAPPSVIDPKRLLPVRLVTDDQQVLFVSAHLVDFLE